MCVACKLNSLEVEGARGVPHFLTPASALPSALSLPSLSPSPPLFQCETTPSPPARATTPLTRTSKRRRARQVRRAGRRPRIDEEMGEVSRERACAPFRFSAHPPSPPLSSPAGYGGAEGAWGNGAAPAWGAAGPPGGGDAPPVISVTDDVSREGGGGGAFFPPSFPLRSLGEGMETGTGAVRGPAGDTHDICPRVASAGSEARAPGARERSARAERGRRRARASAPRPEPRPHYPPLLHYTHTISPPSPPPGPIWPPGNAPWPHARPPSAGRRPRSAGVGAPPARPRGAQRKTGPAAAPSRTTTSTARSPPAPRPPCGPGTVPSSASSSA